MQNSLCELGELNDFEGSKEDSHFFPTSSVSEYDVQTYGPKMKCIREDYQILGNFNTNMASNLMVVFEKCDPTQRSCKSEEEIEKWMRFKYILILLNEKLFIQHEFGE